VIGYQRARRKALIRDVKDSIPDLSEEHVTTAVSYGSRDL
jgi:hypothetical protein